MWKESEHNSVQFPLCGAKRRMEKERGEKAKEQY
jgi:hypothetical protein